MMSYHPKKKHLLNQHGAYFKKIIGSTQFLLNFLLLGLNFCPSNEAAEHIWPNGFSLHLIALL